MYRWTKCLRVLVPNGVAMIKSDGQWQKTVKPRPENIDEWSHYLHDATRQLGRTRRRRRTATASAMGRQSALVAAP